MTAPAPGADLADPAAHPSRFDAAACAADAPATDEQREQIERSLVDALPQAADGLVHALREARTVRDLLDVLTTAQSAIAMTRGDKAAAEFASRYRGWADE